MCVNACLLHQSLKHTGFSLNNLIINLKNKQIYIQKRKKELFIYFILYSYLYNYYLIDRERMEWEKEKKIFSFLYNDNCIAIKLRK